MDVVETARALLLEARPLFVAETANPCLKESGRDGAARDLVELDLSVASGDMEAMGEVMVSAVVLASFEASPKGRGLHGRLRRFGEMVWPQHYAARG